MFSFCFVVLHVCVCVIGIQFEFSCDFHHKIDRKLDENQRDKYTHTDTNDIDIDSTTTTKWKRHTNIETGDEIKRREKQMRIIFVSSKLRRLPVVMSHFLDSVLDFYFILFFSIGKEIRPTLKK